MSIIFLIPFPASALSVRQYESASKDRAAEFVANAIDKIVADVAKMNPVLSRAIHDYFYVIPKGRPESPGLIAFEAELTAVHNLAEKGKLDLDNVQIEGILLDVVKTDVMPKVSASKQPTTNR